MNQLSERNSGGRVALAIGHSLGWGGSLRWGWGLLLICLCCCQSGWAVEHIVFRPRPDSDATLEVTGEVLVRAADGGMLLQAAFI